MRPAVLAAVAALAILLPASASAAITGSTIDSPTGPIFTFTSGDPGAVLTAHVTGAGAGDTADIYGGCGAAEFTLDGPTHAGYPIEDGGVVHAALEDLDWTYCPWQVVPHGVAGPYSTTAFVPRTLGGFGWFPDEAGPDFFWQSVSGPNAYTAARSAGACAIGETFTIQPDYGWIGLLNCSGVLASDPAETTRKLLQVDGDDAYLPGTQPAGSPKPQVSNVTQSVDLATGVTNVSDREGVALCDGAVCTAAPVHLEHHFRADHGGALSTVTDVWHNDGTQPVALKVGYAFRFEINRAQIEHDGAFADVTDATLTSPGGPGFYRVLGDRDQAEDGDVDGARGTIFFSTAPTSVETVSGSPPYLVVRYARTIPAGGKLRLTYGTATAISQSDADAATADALDALKPSVAITAPADHAAIEAPSITVTGTTADDGGPPPVTVNGVAATVKADGTWTAQVPLAAGANTLTASATDADGNTATAARSVTALAPLPPPPPPPPPPPSSITPSVANVSVKHRKRDALVVRADLPGAGTFRAALTTRVRRPAGGKRTLVLARASTVVTAAGRATLRLKPTKQAKRLLRKHAVRAKLKLAFTNTTGTARATRTVRLKRLRT